MQASRLGKLGALAVVAMLFMESGPRPVAASHPEADPVRCDSVNVVVVARATQDVESACAGAEQAMRFLGSLGLDVSGEVNIQVLPELPKSMWQSAAGYYIPSERRIVILTYAAFREFESWFEVPIDAALYRSLIAHEVAHLISDDNFWMDSPTLHAHEYIAYVTQLVTMPAELRERVLEAMPGQAYERDAHMNTMVYMLNPMRFGVGVYRHYLEQRDGADYIRAVLRGEVLHQ